VVCTGGEQKLQQIDLDHENYTSDWVKDYVRDQQALLDTLDFNLLIEDKWNRAYGDPHPDSRFADLKELITWCRERGHRVILSWRAWSIEARSLAVLFDIGNTETTDATHPNFETYIDSCCHFIFGEGGNRLNADGIKIDNLFDVRHPSNARYRDASLGIGITEAYRYLSILYKSAKKYNENCVIIGSAASPHFNDVQDMVALNEDWDNRLRREKRARIISQSLPGLMIFADDVDMVSPIALYHYTTGATYGVPAISYTTRFMDGEIDRATRSAINRLFAFASIKPAGRCDFLDYGHWTVTAGDGIAAECVGQGKAVIHYQDKLRGTLVSTDNGAITIALNDLALVSVRDPMGNPIWFRDHGQQIYELLNLKQGIIYDLTFRKSRVVIE